MRVVLSGFGPKAAASPRSLRSPLLKCGSGFFEHGSHVGKIIDEAAADGVRAAEAISTLVGKDCARLIKHHTVTVPAVHLLDLLPLHPVITLPLAVELLEVSKPTAIKAIESLEKTGILKEKPGKRRDRVDACQKYLGVLTGG